MSSPVPSPVPAGTEGEACCDLYWCPTGGEVECPRHGGFDVCCDRPDLHVPVQAALAAVVSSSPATPAVPIGDVAGIYDHLAPSPATPEGEGSFRQRVIRLVEQAVSGERFSWSVADAIVYQHRRELATAPPPASPAETREGTAAVLRGIVQILRFRAKHAATNEADAAYEDAAAMIEAAWLPAVSLPGEAEKRAEDWLLGESPDPRLPGEQPGGETRWPTYERVVNFAMDDGEDPPAPALPGERADEEGP